MSCRAVAVGLTLALPVVASAQEDERARRVYEIFKTNCLECHGESRKGNLDLRTHPALIKGGASGRVVVPHEPLKSRLFLLVSHADPDDVMPLKRPKLSDDDVEAIRQWIEDGASLEAVEDAVPDEKKAPAALAKLEERPIRPEERQYLGVSEAAASVVPAMAPMPSHQRTQAGQSNRRLSACRDDAEGADALAARRPSHVDSSRVPGRARPAAVSARKSTHLSPTARQTPGRSLSTGSSPRRITANAGRGTGSTSSGTRIPAASSSTWIGGKPGATAITSSTRSTATSRIRSSSASRSPVTSTRRRAPQADDAMIATGFLRLGPEGGGGGERGRQDSLEDVIATTTLTFTGLTVACARCHNHKFDPIPQKDYYRIQAVFYSTRPVGSSARAGTRSRRASRRDGADRWAAQAAAPGKAGPRSALPETARGPRDRAAARVPADGVEDAGQPSVPRDSG